MRSLRRAAIGSFVIDEARPLDDLVVLPAREALRDYQAVIVDDAVARDIGFGKVLPCERLGVVGDGPWAHSEMGRPGDPHCGMPRLPGCVLERDPGSILSCRRTADRRPPHQRIPAPSHVGPEPRPAGGQTGG